MANYKITIAQTWSETVVVKAKTAQEAKNKAWKKYKHKKKNHTLDAEKE